jgi:hypothetical protein
VVLVKQIGKPFRRKLGLQIVECVRLIKRSKLPRSLPKQIWVAALVSFVQSVLELALTIGYGATLVAELSATR